MAGIGAAPKPANQRRRYGQPARSEWVELEPLAEPVLGSAQGVWSPAARRLWRAWRRDPVTTQWGPADVAFAKELCRLYEKLQPNEARLRMDGLGLTPKGKRDLRWRTPQEVKTIAVQPPVQRLRAVMQQEPGA